MMFENPSTPDILRSSITSHTNRGTIMSNMMSDPQVVVKATIKAVNARRPKPRYLIGFGAKLLVFAHAILPTRVFDFIMTHAS